MLDAATPTRLFASLPPGTEVQRMGLADAVELTADGIAEVVLGEPLGRWFATPGRDAAVLVRTLREHGEVRLFQTTLTGILGTETDVEICATASSAGGPLAMGLLVRDIRRRAAAEDSAGDLHVELAEVLREMGRLPLPILVRNTAAVVERACIEQALRTANGNRTAAAEALGLSRQSLYAKLELYGMHEMRDIAEEDVVG
jgi:transcriptional regulator PpsR